MYVVWKNDMHYKLCFETKTLKNLVHLWMEPIAVPNPEIQRQQENWFDGFKSLD